MENDALRARSGRRAQVVVGIAGAAIVASSLVGNLPPLFVVATEAATTFAIAIVGGRTQRSYGAAAFGPLAASIVLSILSVVTLIVVARTKLLCTTCGTCCEGYGILVFAEIFVGGVLAVAGPLVAAGVHAIARRP